MRWKKRTMLTKMRMTMKMIEIEQGSETSIWNESELMGSRS